MIKLKTADEINRIKDSGQILADTVKELKKIEMEGIPTEELDKFAKAYILKRGAKPAFLGYQGFPGSLCISLNDEVIHGIPGKRKILNGDLVSIDIGVFYKGYYSDSAFSVAVGTVDEKVKKLLEVTEKCLFLGIEQAVNGRRISDISKAVFNHASASGFGVVREYCGHGLGSSLHEDPQIPNYISNGSNPRIKAGMVFAIEPMINIGKHNVYVKNDDWTVATKDGSVSAHFEHTVAVFEDHTEILTLY
jgi:methionyl aminopeptidase